MISICGNDALRELSSPGKSGSFFYLTHDDRYMIKTVKKSEVKVRTYALTYGFSSMYLSLYLSVYLYLISIFLFVTLYIYLLFPSISSSISISISISLSLKTCEHFSIYFILLPFAPDSILSICLSPFPSVYLFITQVHRHFLPYLSLSLSPTHSYYLFLSLSLSVFSIDLLIYSLSFFHPTYFIYISLPFLPSPSLFSI